MKTIQKHSLARERSEIRCKRDDVRCGRFASWSAASAVMTLAMTGCVGAPEESDGVSEEVAGSVQSLVYGTDDRTEYLGVTDPRFKRMADATAGLTVAGAMSCGAGTCSFTTGSYVNSDLLNSGGNPVPLCSAVRFRGQGTFPFCTAFQVGPKTFMTAGHCMNGAVLGAPMSCSSGGSAINAIFGFNANASGVAPTSVPSANVYTCVGTPAGAFNALEDWAVFTVDRVVTGRNPLIAEYSGSGPSVNTELAVFGHGSGLPLKMSRNTNVKINASSDVGFFWANADIFPGNSGGPNVDVVTGVVRGITQGRPAGDYVLQGSCAVLNVCSATTGCSSTQDVWTHHSRVTRAARIGRVPLHTALTTVIL